MSRITDENKAKDFILKNYKVVGEGWDDNACQDILKHHAERQWMQDYYTRKGEQVEFGNNIRSLGLSSRNKKIFIEESCGHCARADVRLLFIEYKDKDFFRNIEGHFFGKIDNLLVAFCPKSGGQIMISRIEYMPLQRWFKI